MHTTAWNGQMIQLTIIHIAYYCFTVVLHRFVDSESTRQVDTLDGKPKRRANRGREADNMRSTVKCTYVVGMR